MPLPVGRPLHARAWLDRRDGRRWYQEWLARQDAAAQDDGSAILNHDGTNSNPSKK